MDTAALHKITAKAPQVLLRTPGFEFAKGEDRAFHAASVGKMLTATLAFQLAERGALDLDAPVTIDEVEGLASGPVTARQLLTHTGGIADYFEGGVRKLAKREPDRRWTPNELLDFTRTNRQPRSRPGERFAYSDTGYVLLGRVIEETVGAPLASQLHERILDPAGMSRSCLLFHSSPGGGPAISAAALDIAPLLIDGVDLSRAESLSCDWAGGGVVTTLDDLLRFDSAWHAGELIGEASRQAMGDIRHRFRPGIHYGAGLMQLRYEGFMPLLRGLPRLTGHLGVTGAHLFSGDGVQLAMNFGDTRLMRKSFVTHIELLRKVLSSRR